MTDPVRRAALFATAAVMIALRAGPARAGDVVGEIHLPGAPTEHLSANPYPGRVGAASRPAGESGSASELADAVVYIESLDPPFPYEPPTGAAMAQRGQAFVPRVLPIMIHQIVAFPNDDPIYHNVFSYSPCCRFDLGRYPRGKSKSVTFDETGIVRVFCEIHSNMAGFVLVLQNPCFTKPGLDGHYRITSVPPGIHTLVFWHPEIGRRSWPVTVPADSTVTFDLGL